MKRFLPVFFFVFATIGQTEAAWDTGSFFSCNAINPKPEVIIKSSYGRLVHDLSKSKAEINAIHNKNPHVKEPRNTVVGLASFRMPTRIKVSGQRRKINETYSCILPTKVEIEIGLNDPVIYVAKEYPRQSCGFSQVIRHEQTHQRINLLTLEYFMPIFDKALRKAIYDVRAVKVYTKDNNNFKKGLSKLNEYYYARLTPILEEFEKARAKEQQKLDNITSYRRDWEICNEFEKEHPEKKIPYKI